MKKPQPWERLSRTLVQKTVVFDLYADKLRSPRNGVVDDFYLIDVVDWVNIIALTEAREVIMVEQYRFGIEQNSLELPGGMLSNREEDPKLAIARELEEETGYSATTIESLGSAHPNPAIQTNTCHFYFAPLATPGGKVSQDELEDITLRLEPLADIPKLIEQEQITHSLMVVAFMRLALKHGFDVFKS